MPEAPIMVVNIETGDYTYMHSIDASEACGLGDYRMATAEEVSGTSAKKTAALHQFRNLNVTPPPELQTPEQKAAIRAAAAEEAARVAAVQEHYAAGEAFGVRQAMGAAPAGSPPAAAAPTPTSSSEGSSRRGRSGE